jgi:expansin (peptidoglycan-binding protein)
MTILGYMCLPMLLALAGLSTAQAAEPETLRLSCEGMVTVTDKVTVTDNTKMEADAKPEPVVVNVIVDFTDRTVQGLFYLQSSLDYQVKITAMNKATVTFGGISDSKVISGKIDRVTGDMSATSVSTEGKDLILLKNYSLKCRPTQRMF